MKNNLGNSELQLYSYATGETQPMPIDDVGPLIGLDRQSDLIRQIILNKFVSKFTGFVQNNDLCSKVLHKTGIASKVNLKIDDIFEQNHYLNYNQAFIHRYDYKLYPEANEGLPQSKIDKMLASPAEAYLNVRDIDNAQVQLYPELNLDIAQMIGEKNAQIFQNGGKFLLFTLKPFHDHTMDYPFNSQVLSEPYQMDAKRFRVHSTDLHYARFIARLNGNGVFDENNRVVSELYAEDFDQKYFFVEIGALNVNSIEQDNCEVGRRYSRGTQKSHFNFGSTVALLLPKSFSDQLYFPEYLVADQNTSTEVKRGNIVAVSQDCPEGIIFSVADKVAIMLEKDENNQMAGECVFRESEKIEEW